jgi:hypothetical protein
LDGGFVSFCLQVQRNSILVLEGNGGKIGLFQINNQTPVWEMEKKGKKNDNAHLTFEVLIFSTPVVEP